MSPAPVRGSLEFPKPTADDAVALAVDLFESGERVDMAHIAQRLGVGRSTLYRWVGDREELMDRVILQTSRKLSASIRRRVRGRGLDRIVCAVRLYLDATTQYEPLRSLAEREPRLALQVIMSPDGVFAAHTRELLRKQLDLDLPELAVSEQVLEVITSTNLALVWASIAGGYDPGISTAIEVLRTVLLAQMNGEPPT